MKVERVASVSLEPNRAEEYAVTAAETHLGKKVDVVKSLGGGSFGSAFDVTFGDGSHAVVKLMRAKDMLEKEVYDLGLLKEHCPVRVPKVYFTHPADDVVPIDCYGMEKIAGKGAAFAFDMLFCKKKRKAFADELTDALHSVHECRSELFGDTLNPEFTDWRDCYKPFAKAILDRAEEASAAGELSEKILVAMRAAWEKFDVIFSENVTEACLIHGDLNVCNVMVDKKRKITGIIDPMNSMYADREYDLFQFDNITGKRLGLSKTYRAKFGESKYCDQKLAFYGLYNEVFCYIKAGTLFNFIMNPLVKNMHRQLKKL